MRTTSTRALSATSPRQPLHFEMRSAALLRPVAAIAATIVACTAWAANDSALKAGAFKPARLAPELALRGSNGTELKLSQYRGKVVALGFGYTTCPDV